MAIESTVGRALRDPTTGLPNATYFRLIRDWEERRARRRDYQVRVLNVVVRGGSDLLRQALGWRLQHELRRSDLVASDGPTSYHVLLTSPDAENVEMIAARVQAVARAVSALHPDESPLVVTVDDEGEGDRRAARPAGVRDLRPGRPHRGGDAESAAD